MKIEYIEHTPSTNDHILGIDEDMALVYSDYQSCGRGQRGNSWESEQGKNLTFSFMLKPHQMRAEKQFSISKIVAIAIARTLNHYSIDAKIKWPNDVYVGDNKIAGILIENRLSAGGMLSKIICGIGLNVNQTKFVSNAPNPVSMKQICGKELDRIAVLERFCYEFEHLYSGGDIPNALQIDSLYWDNIYRKEHLYRYEDSTGQFSGKIVGIGLYGELLVEREDTGLINSYLFKDVKYII